MGFGHRVYKNYDPRRASSRSRPTRFWQAGRRRRAARHCQVPRRSRADRRLLHRAQAVPQRRLLHRRDLPGDGLPHEDVHRAVRARPAPGWIAHWREMREEPNKIGRRARSTPATANATTPIPAAAEAGRPAGGRLPGRKNVILFSCCLSLLIVSMDATIVNVAIPSIRADLGASGTQFQWSSTFTRWCWPRCCCWAVRPGQVRPVGGFSSWV